MIKRIALIPLVLICFLFLGYFSPVFADSDNSTNIEKIETTNNGEIIHYKNGGTEAFFGISDSLGSSSATPLIDSNNPIEIKNKTNEVTAVISDKVGLVDHVSYSFEIAPSPFPWGLIGLIFEIGKQISDIIREILDGISPVGIAELLLATQILIMFRNLRQNQPIRK